MSTQLQNITMSLSSVVRPLGLIKIGEFVHCNLGSSSFPEGATSKLYLSGGLQEENYVVGTHKYEAPLGKIWLPG